MKRTLCFTLGLTLAVLCGCAVLTVDVDVYTGPMANTVDVQAEQVIALVMGAKPLLVQLRDRLEVASYSRHALKTQKGAEELIRSEPSLQDDLARFRSQKWYWAGFFPPQPGPGESPHLRNDSAICVNDVLALYEDRTPWDLAPLMDRGRAAFRGYTDAYARFRPAGTNEEVRAWNGFARQFKCPVNCYTNDPMSLSNAYRRLLVQTSNTFYGPTLWREGINLVSHFPPATYLKLYKNTNDSNAIFEFLCNSNVVADHATKLFGAEAKTDRIRKQFQDKVRETAKAFIDTREAAHELLVAALEAHLIAFRTNAFGEDLVNPSQRQTIRTASAEVVAATLEPWLLAASITNSPDPALADLTLRFRSASLPVGQAGTEWHNRHYMKAKDEIKNALAHYGASLSAALLALDAELQRSGVTNEACRFGLAQGPNCAAASLLPSPEVRQALSQLQALAYCAFGGGRQQQGMETLIEDYLRSARANPWFEDRSQSNEFNLLLDALVAFGQKVVTLGNAAGLVDPRDDEEVWKYTTVLQYVGNAVLVHVDELKNRAQHQAHLRKGAKLTAQLLHEAGFTNSLFANTDAQFFKTNELDAKDLLEHLLDSLRARQIKAILDQPGLYTNTLAISSWATNAATNTLILLNLAAVTNVSLATTANVASSTALVTNIISVAGTSNVAGVCLALTNRLDLAALPDKFLTAIDRVAEMKNNRIYLRPASAYLRSSYPATALRPNTSVAWQNELERQAWRSVPMAASLFSGDSPILWGNRSRRKLFNELDKQSWQNINRVRVSGAGKANYAITKDDVGNWYVKGYSANPSQIFESARNLALFSAGGVFRPALSNLLVNPPAILSTNAAFAAQLAKAQADYEYLTTNTWKNLTNDLLGETFANKIQRALSSAGLDAANLNELSTNALSGKIQGIHTNVLASGRKISEAAGTSNSVACVDAETLNVLYAVKRYHASVLPALKLSGTNQTNELKRARQEFTASVREFLEDKIAERERALERLEAGLQLIQTATGP